MTMLAKTLILTVPFLAAMLGATIFASPARAVNECDAHEVVSQDGGCISPSDPHVIFNWCSDGTCAAVTVAKPGETMGDVMRRVHRSVFNVRVIHAASFSSSFEEHGYHKAEWSGRTYCSLIPRRTRADLWQAFGTDNLDTPVFGYVSLTLRQCN